jgi:hypothetical protein
MDRETRCELNTRARAGSCPAGAATLVQRSVAWLRARRHWPSCRRPLPIRPAASPGQGRPRPPPMQPTHASMLYRRASGTGPSATTSLECSTVTLPHSWLTTARMGSVNKSASWWKSIWPGPRSQSPTLRGGFPVVGRVARVGTGDNAAMALQACWYSAGTLCRRGPFASLSARRSCPKAEGRCA